MPSGPSDQARVRNFSDDKLRQLVDSPHLMADKLKFMAWLEGLTNDILGITSERSTPTSRLGRAIATTASSSSSSSSSSASSAMDDLDEERYVSQHISADMREPSFAALGKLQQIRANVASLLSGNGAKPSGTSRATQREEEPNMPIHSEYPFSSSFKAAAGGAEAMGEATIVQNENERPKATPTLNRAPSPMRLPREQVVDKSVDASAPLPHPAPAAAATSSSLPEPKMDDGFVELDFSGTWKSARGERARYHATIDTNIVQPPAGKNSGDAQTTITLRGSVDLSGLSLEGVRALSGNTY